MRRRRRGNTLGWAFVLGGIAIVLALIMPTGFWWFALALMFIGFGIWLMRC